VTILRNLYRKGLVTATLFIGSLVLATTCVLSQEAAAHSAAITECRNNIIYDEAVLLEETLQSGYWAEHYDTNGDGKLDVMALSHILDMQTREDGVYYKHDPNPVFWMVDRQEFDTTGDGLPDTVEYDGDPDTVFIDINGEGNCDDIKFYQDLRVPRNPNMDSLPDAEI